MNRKLLAALKIFYIAISIALLVAPVFVASVNYDIIGFCFVVAAVLSMPLSNVAAAIMSLLGLLPLGSIGEMYLAMFLFCVLGYVQWFFVAPRFFKRISRKFQFSDYSVCLNVNSKRAKTSLAQTTAKQLNEPLPDFYDERQRTPVERLFDKPTDKSL